MSLYVVELFPCSGGMAEGFRRAGLDVSIAFDWDADACRSYEANLGHAPIQMDVRSLVRLAREGWRPPRPIDLLLADPPCTPWSRAGKRLGLADDRDLIEDTCELIRLWRPRAYLVANVPGLDDSVNLETVQRTIGSLSRDGYCVRDFARLDAANYGVPQHRIRPFWYGHLSGPCIAWPAPTHGDPASLAPTLQGVAPLLPWITCRQALGHLSGDELGVPVRLRWRGKDTGGSKRPRASHVDAPAATVTIRDGSGSGTVLFDGPNHRPSKADAPARTITRNTHSDGALLASQVILAEPHHPPSFADEPAMTVRAGDGGGARACLQINGRYPIDVADSLLVTVTAKDRGAHGACALEWPWDRPSTTVTARPGLAEPWHHISSNMSTPNAVKLSERAAKILQGFPETWIFSGDTKKARWAQLGMAMPPPLAEAVARSLKKALTS